MVDSTLPSWPWQAVPGAPVSTQVALTCPHGHVLGIVRMPATAPRLFLFRRSLMSTVALNAATPEHAAILGSRSVVSCSLCLEPVVWSAEPIRTLEQQQASGFPFNRLEFKIGR